MLWIFTYRLCVKAYTVRHTFHVDYISVKVDRASSIKIFIFKAKQTAQDERTENIKWIKKSLAQF